MGGARAGVDLAELDRVLPPTFHLPDGLTCLSDDLPTTIDPSIANGALHNSIHPLWIPQLSGYLLMAHRHYKRGHPFRWGWSYVQLFILTDAAFQVKRYSKEICLAPLVKLLGAWL